VPVIAKPEGMLIDGERRWRAAKLGGVEHLDTIITEGVLTDAEVKEIQLITLQRVDLKPYEFYLACKEWMKAPGAKAQELAPHIGRDVSHVSRILSLSKCIPAVVEAAEAGLLGISDWVAISKVSEQEQHVLLAAKRSGASRDDLERKGRKARNGHAPVIKARSWKVPLASGVTFSIQGAESFDAAIEAILELQKKLKHARDKNWDEKTAQKVWRDEAKGE